MLRTCLDRLHLRGGESAGFFLVLIFVLVTALSVGRKIGVDVPSGDDFAAGSLAASLMSASMASRGIPEVLATWIDGLKPSPSG